MSAVTFPRGPRRWGDVNGPPVEVDGKASEHADRCPPASPSDEAALVARAPADLGHRQSSKFHVQSRRRRLLGCWDFFFFALRRSTGRGTAAARWLMQPAPAIFICPLYTQVRRAGSNTSGGGLRILLDLGGRRRRQATPLSAFSSAFLPTAMAAASSRTAGSIFPGFFRCFSLPPSAQHHTRRGVMGGGWIRPSMRITQRHWLPPALGRVMPR